MLLEDGNHGLAFCIDNRSDLCNSLRENKSVELCWFFPLTRDKFRVKVQVLVLNSESIAKNEEIKKLVSVDLFNAIWEGLDKEEKKVFTELNPDTHTVEKKS